MSKALREQLLSEKNSYGIMLSEMYVPNITRLIARCGFDFILIDCEHGYFDMSQVANLIAVADGAEISTIVRVTQPSRTNITKYLDMGAHGILLSDVTGADDARRLAELCRYAPKGCRGISTFRAHTGYSNEHTGPSSRRTTTCPSMPRPGRTSTAAISKTAPWCWTARPCAAFM